MRFQVEDDELTITLEGIEQFWALKRQLVVHRQQITDLQWHQQFVIPRSQVGFRVGTAIPGSLWAGRFTASTSRNFLYVQQTRGLFGDITMAHVLILELQNADFQHLYLTINDPDMADRLIAWWRTA